MIVGSAWSLTPVLKLAAAQEPTKPVAPTEHSTEHRPQTTGEQNTGKAAAANTKETVEAKEIAIIVAVVLIVIAVPSISGVCYYRKKAHERSEREENQTMMMVSVGEGAQELLEAEPAPRTFAGTGGWWFPLPHRDLKYSWTPPCQTRLSRTPRYIELFLAPLNSNPSRLSRTVFGSEETLVNISQECSQGTSWQDVLKAEKC